MNINDYPELKSLLLDLMTANNGELAKAYSVCEFVSDRRVFNAYVDEMEQDLLEDRMCEAMAGDEFVSQVIALMKNYSATALRDYIIEQRNEILTIDINQLILQMHSVVEEYQNNA